MSPIRSAPRHRLATARGRIVHAAGPFARSDRSGAARVAVLVGAVGAIACAIVIGGPALAADEAHSDEAAAAPKPSGPVLVASSVCEAHELRFRKEQDPSIQIEIPAEYASQWPSRAACESAREAWDPEAPGPLQPIPFSHKHHAGQFGIDCQYCHSNTEQSAAAGVPSVELCMGCHAQFPPQYDEIEGIRILKEAWAEKKPIEWNQIHRLPEHVQFRHNRHLVAGVDCQRCHGPVEQMDKVYLVPDGFWKYGVPVKKLEMGWCINCHRENEAQIDCLRCHY